MIGESISEILRELPSGVKLVAVSKYHHVDAIREAVSAGQKAFGENRPQELAQKAQELSSDIEWHFIGHLQTNKLKMVLPYAAMVQSVDSVHLLQEIDRWGRGQGRVVKVLLELHIGAEETKQGFHEEEVLDLMFNADKYSNVCICGLMGMASHTDAVETIRADFQRISSFMDYLKDLFPEYTEFKELSIGMSEDWRIALEYGATIIRIGTAIFGPREY